MADEKISALPAAGTLDGTEPVPVVKGGETKQTTTQAIANLIVAGNANITPITVAALQGLQAGSTLSTTTIYIVTDASPYVLAMQFKVNNQNVTTATILDAAFGGEVLYTISTNTWANGTIYDVDGNVFIGVYNGTNVLSASGNNVFYPNAGSNNLSAASSNNTFSNYAESNILVNSINNTFGSYASNNNLTNSSNNIFEAFAIGNTIGDASFTNRFELYAQNNEIGENCFFINFKSNSINNVIGNDCDNVVFEENTDGFLFADELNYCTIKSGLLGTSVDFSAATQLYNRTEYWSINKILGTDLIEVTFDSSLSTAQTGTYNTATDTFTPNIEPTITTYILSTNFAAPADATIYYLGINPTSMFTTANRRDFKFPVAHTITTVSLALEQSVNGSGETVTIYLRNITTGTDYTIGTFASNFGAGIAYKVLFTGLSIAVNTTDDWAVKILTPTWATNPTNWTIGMILSGN